MTAYAPTLPAPTRRLEISARLAVLLALVTLALVGAVGFAAATLLPRSHSVQHTTFQTP